MFSLKNGSDVKIMDEYIDYHKKYLTVLTIACFASLKIMHFHTKQEQTFMNIIDSPSIIKLT